MRRIVARLTSRLMPKATGKASPVEGRCYPGCGTGVWLTSPGKTPTGKVPCC